jgi:polar amino acid transport system substrate-binding protein
MKTFFKLKLVIIGCCLLIACSEENTKNVLHFSTSAEYPPFEYNDHGIIKGFDIELAKLICKELGKEAIFDNMQFSTVLPAVSSGQADAAIATLTITEERKKNFDFSEPYFFEGMATVYQAHHPITNSSQLKGQTIAVQLGSLMELWLREKYPDTKILALDSNPQAIEALLAGHVDGVLMDGAQATVFSKKHQQLNFSIIAKAESGYALVLPKNSPLTPSINKALQKLKANGEIQKLEKIWLKGEL